VIHESSDVASAAVVDSTGDDSRNCTQTRTGTYCCFREDTGQRCSWNSHCSALFPC
jgi:hypothetical protein